ELEAPEPGAAADTVLAAGVVDEDAAHGLGGRREEVHAAVPERLRAGADELEIRLVDQGRGLEGVSRPLASEAPGRQPAQLFVDERQELLGGVRVALVDRV